MRYLIALAIISGCASHAPKEFTGPNGRQAYAMRCHNSGCYERAGQLCRGGYTILDSSSGPVGVGGVVSTRREIAFECK